VAGNFGGVVVSAGRRFLLRVPAGQFGSLAWTFAKTQAKPRGSPEQVTLRAVREKAGYDALIRQRLPGVFDGASGPSTFFLMEARHPPRNRNWQTDAVQWTRSDEAGGLIALSTNGHGRRRVTWPFLTRFARARNKNSSLGRTSDEAGLRMKMVDARRRPHCRRASRPGFVDRGTQGAWRDRRPVTGVDRGRF